MAAHHTQQQRPEKPCPDFPLFPHGCGQWAKKIHGRMHYFGPWADPEGAERALQAFLAKDASGRLPIAPANNTQAFSRIVDAYITKRHGDLQAKTIGLRYYRDLTNMVKALAKLIDLTRPVNALGPADWARAHQQLRRKHGASTVTRFVVMVRTMLKWAAEMGLIDQMRTGPDFKVVPVAQLRREQGARGTRLYEPTDVKRMIEAATNPLKAMLLLAMNGGMGNEDLGSLRLGDVDLKRGFYDSTRHKTGVRRRFPLWPDTIKALKVVIASRPKPLDPTNADLVFLTAFGVPFVRTTAIVKDGDTVGARSVDSIGFLFNRLLLGLEIRKPSPKNELVGLTDGRGFYSLRRLHRTLADDLKDTSAARRIMGHADPGIEKHYVLDVPDARLMAVTDHVRSKIFDSTPAVPGATAVRRRGAKGTSGGKTSLRSSGRKR